MRNKMIPFVGLLLSVGLGSCVDKFIPEVKEAFDRDVNFTKTLFDPVMGRTTVYTEIFNRANSTLPITFEIKNMRHNDGTPAPELTEFYPVKLWKTPYLGTEKSLEEIEAKRGIGYRRLFDVVKHSGEIVLWAEANSSILRCQPDSGYVFDIEASNSGGYKYTQRMKFMPKREVDFEPSIIDSYSGLATAEYVTPTSLKIYSEEEKLLDLTDVHIYFREIREEGEDNKGSTLKLSFFNKDWTVINPARFNETKWDNLFQAGFLKEQTDTYVLYDMAYPLPLFEDKTTYTSSNGKLARITLNGNFVSEEYGMIVRRLFNIVFEFAIYREANWELMFHFATTHPRLGD